VSRPKPASQLTIDVWGIPAPQGSKRGFVNNGRVSMVESSAKVKPWRQDVKYAAYAALSAGGNVLPPPLTGPVQVAVTFTLTRPKSHYGTGGNSRVLKILAPRYPAGKPDIDKLLRSTLDALGEAGVWRDDAQVCFVTARKIYGDVAGARIHVRELVA